MIQKTKASEVFAKVGLSKSYGYQFLNGKRKPSRDKVLQLSFEFPLSIKETNTLLRIAEKNELFVKTKRDAIIQFALNNNLTFMETNELLFEEKCGILE